MAKTLLFQVHNDFDTEKLSSMLNKMVYTASIQLTRALNNGIRSKKLSKHKKVVSAPVNLTDKVEELLDKTPTMQALKEEQTIDAFSDVFAKAFARE